MRGSRLEVGVEKENCHIVQTVTGSAFCDVITGRVWVRMEEEKMDLGKLVSEKGKISPPQDHRGGNLLC